MYIVPLRWGPTKEKYVLLVICKFKGGDSSFRGNLDAISLEPTICVMIGLLDAS